MILERMRDLVVHRRNEIFKRKIMVLTIKIIHFNLRRLGEDLNKN